MASLETLRMPVDGQEFLDLDALSLALDDWAVKEKFAFRVERRDAHGATWVCAEEWEGDGECPWRCRARRGEDESWVLALLEPQHRCVTRGERIRRSSSKKEWLDPVVSRHLAVTKATKPQEIVDLLRVGFSEARLSYKVAQLCRMRLLDSDIGKQRHSFELLPAYKTLLESVDPEVHVDLMVDIHGKSLSFLSSILQLLTIYRALPAHIRLPVSLSRDV
jgi:hypothetical protein